MKGTRTIMLTSKETVDLLLLAGLKGSGLLPSDARPLYQVVYEESQEVYICLESETWGDHKELSLTTSRNHRGVQMQLMELGDQVPFFVFLRLKAHMQRLGDFYPCTDPKIRELASACAVLNKGHNRTHWYAAQGEVTFY